MFRQIVRNLGSVKNEVLFSEVESALTSVAPFLLSRGAVCEEIIAWYLSLVSQGRIAVSSWSIIADD